MNQRPFLCLLLVLTVVTVLMFTFIAFTQPGAVGSLYLNAADVSPKAISLTSVPLNYTSVDHCPYYPPEASHIPLILSESTLLQCQDAEKKVERGKPVILVTVNYNHFHFLANWLCVSARYINTQNLIVAVPPEESNFVDVLRSKGINAIQTKFRNECLKQKKVGQMDQFHLALLIRNLMIMLLTDWGHDVAVFDPDAFILKDPMEMYQMIVQETQAHVIGQLGNMPRGLKSKWGFTLCAGAMYYHSLPPLKNLWRAISDKHLQPGIVGGHGTTDDQKLLNFALFRLGIRWQKTDPQQSRPFDSFIGTAGSLIVVAVSANYSARASYSEYKALDHEKLRILHAKLSRYTNRKDHAILRFQDSLWKVSANFSSKPGSNVEKVTDLNRWLEEICLK